MHKTSNLHKKIRPFAVRHAVYILHRVPTKANQNYMPPYERLKQEKPNLQNLKIFGSLLYGNVHKVQSSDWKMDARGVPMAYIGDGQIDGSQTVIGYKIGKEKTVATVYTTSFWSDPTTLPCRPRSDRRITSCSFGSYPDIEKESTDLYTSPSDDAVIQNMDDSEIKVADLKILVNEPDDQRNKQLLEGLKKPLDVMKSKQRESPQNGGVPDNLENVESSPEQSLIDLEAHAAKFGLGPFKQVVDGLAKALASLVRNHFKVFDTHDFFGSLDCGIHEVFSGRADRSIGHQVFPLHPGNDTAWCF